MVVKGKVRRTKVLSSARGRQVTVEVVEPEASTENIRALREVSDRWHKDAIAITEGRAQGRAFFAASVAFEAADKLQTPSCCVLVARDQATGEVLGVGTYRPNQGPWHLDNLTVSPANQPGGEGRDQIRGIGTLMVGEIAEDVASRMCSELRLFALDREAEEFWRNRGFHNTIAPLRLSCPEVRDLARELASSHPDRPDEGDVVLAGDLDRWRQVEMPAALAKLRDL